MAGRPKRTEEVTSLLLRLPPALLSKLDRCKAILELREGRSLTRTSVLGRALDVGTDVLIGEGEEYHFLTRMASTMGGQPAEVRAAARRQPRQEPAETATVPETSQDIPRARRRAQIQAVIPTEQEHPQGLTAAEIAKITGIPRKAVLSDLRYIDGIAKQDGHYVRVAQVQK